MKLREIILGLEIHLRSVRPTGIVQSVNTNGMPPFANGVCSEIGVK